MLVALLQAPTGVKMRASSLRYDCLVFSVSDTFGKRFAMTRKDAAGKQGGGRTKKASGTLAPVVEAARRGASIAPEVWDIVFATLPGRPSFLALVSRVCHLWKEAARVALHAVDWKVYACVWGFPYM